MNTQPPTRQRKTRIGAAPQPPKIEYIYHWNRITGALIALLLSIIGYLLVNPVGLS